MLLSGYFERYKANVERKRVWMSTIVDWEVDTCWGTPEVIRSARAFFIGDLSHGDGGDYKEPETGSRNMEVSEKRGVPSVFVRVLLSPSLQYHYRNIEFHPEMPAQYLSSRRDNAEELEVNMKGSTQVVELLMASL